MKRIITYILFALILTSCGESEIQEIVETGEVDLSFSLSIPEASDVNLKSFDENSIRSIDLLVFDQNNKYLQRIPVNNVSGTGAVKTFNVRLAAIGQARTFHIIANGRNANNADIVNFTSITASENESTAIPKLKTNTLAAKTAPEMPLIMWGRVTVSNITATTNLGTVNMLRSVAAVRAECVTPTSTNGLGDFSLEKITVLNTNNVGKVAPAAYNAPATIPTTVSLLTGTPAYINYVEAPSGTGAWGTVSGNRTEDLYVYERTNVLDNTGLSVIIHGKYKNEWGYYKVWLRNNTGNVLHVVRNHRYIIQIAKISGPGYMTLQQAINATHSADIQVQILDNHYKITDIVADSTHELGISSNTLTVKGSGSHSLGIALKTNSAESLSITSNVSWITQCGYTQNGTYCEMKAVFAATTVTRTATITVRAGNLYRTIAVTQIP